MNLLKIFNICLEKKESFFFLVISLFLLSITFYRSEIIYNGKFFDYYINYYIISGFFFFYQFFATFVTKKLIFIFQFFF